MTDQADLHIYKKIVAEAAKLEKDIEDKVSTGQTIILLVGDTGAGKTTTTALLDGKELVIKRTGPLRKLDLPGYGIGHGGESKTQSLIFHTTSQGFLICDCPGFEDTQGAETEILHSYRLFRLLASGKQLKVKVLLVVSANVIWERKTYLDKTMKRVQKMFPETKSLIKMVGLVVTKCECCNMEGNGFNDEEACPLLKEFDNIFFFPKPELKDQTYETGKTDLDKLMKFVSSNENWLDGAKVGISLNGDALYMIQGAVHLQAERNAELLKTICDMLMNECKAKLKDEKEVGIRIKYLQEKLSTIEKMDQSDDPQYLISNCRSDPEFKEIISSLTQSLSLTFYLEQVSGRKEITVQLKKAKDLNFDTLINWLKSEIVKEEETRKVEEEMKRKEEEIKNLEIEAEEKERLMAEERQRAAADMQRIKEEHEKERRAREEQMQKMLDAQIEEMKQNSKRMQDFMEKQLENERKKSAEMLTAQQAQFDSMKTLYSDMVKDQHERYNKAMRDQEQRYEAMLERERQRQNDSGSCKLA